jgi:hypothetical protein
VTLTAVLLAAEFHKRYLCHALMPPRMWGNRSWTDIVYSIGGLEALRT